MISLWPNLPYLLDPCKGVARCSTGQDQNLSTFFVVIFTQKLHWEKWSYKRGDKWVVTKTKKRKEKLEFGTGCASMVVKRRCRLRAVATAAATAQKEEAGGTHTSTASRNQIQSKYNVVLPATCPSVHCSPRTERGRYIYALFSLLFVFLFRHH